MNKIENLRDLYIQQGRELFNSGAQQLAELPKIEMQVHSPQLRKIINRQILKIQNQQVRLAQALKRINASPEGEKCLATESILKVAQFHINRASDPSVRDAGIIVHMQYLVHLEVAGFGSAKSFAREIGQEESANTFMEVLHEERDLDSQYSELADLEINRLATMTSELDKHELR
jgi:ferritin-like metal-binding protein YciE